MARGGELIGKANYNSLLKLMENDGDHLKDLLEEFLLLLHADDKFLSGIVHGPQVRLPLAELRKALPARYPIRDYPDITHSRHCQYPVPDWDVSFALTEGREGSNPRPTQTADPGGG